MLEGLEHGSSIPAADAKTITPRRQGIFRQGGIRTLELRLVE
jgi:hypothetical protein